SILRALSAVCLDNRDRLKMIVEFWPYGLRQAGESGHALLETLRLLNMPSFIIDHLGFSLMPIDIDGLEEWVTQTDQTPDNQGFINLFMSSP
ncbi:MAG: hypothetical protein U9P80_08570, partial [Thermodesulfobacteriota bacterium]|nr:hypothetical protein [Thermodesulfobacteriota bacterium]